MSRCSGRWRATWPEADLRAAADRDLGDWFRFEIGAAAITGDSAVRLSAKAVIGATDSTAAGLRLGHADRLPFPLTGRSSKGARHDHLSLGGPLHTHAPGAQAM